VILHKIEQLHLTIADRTEAEKALFKYIKDNPNANPAGKFVWGDVVNGPLHKMVKRLYPNSEVGEEYKNPNSGHMVLLGEILVKDL